MGKTFGKGQKIRIERDHIEIYEGRVKIASIRNEDIINIEYIAANKKRMNNIIINLISEFFFSFFISESEEKGIVFTINNSSGKYSSNRFIYDVKLDEIELTELKKEINGGN